jgi:hypothetical protein
MADSLRLRRDKVYAIRRTPRQTVTICARACRNVVIGAE